MNKAAPLIALGLGLITVGAFWSLYNDSLSYFDSFIIENEFTTLFELGWDSIPIIFLLVGIMCLIAAGISASGSEHRGDY